MVTQQEINSQQRDENGFVKVLSFDKHSEKGRDMQNAFRSFENIIKKESQSRNISFNKHYYDVVATAKNNLISEKVSVNNKYDINAYMKNLMNEILAEPNKFSKSLEQAKNNRNRLHIVQPQNEKQQAIEDIFQSFYHNCIKSYREINKKQLMGDFYEKWQETKNYMVSNEIPVDNVKKYLENTLAQLERGVYDKVENSNKDYSSKRNTSYNNQQRGNYNSSESRQQYGRKSYGYNNDSQQQEQGGYNQGYQKKSSSYGGYNQGGYQKSKNDDYAKTQQQGYNVSAGYGNNATNTNIDNNAKKVNSYQGGYQKKNNNYSNDSQQQEQGGYNQGYQKKSSSYGGYNQGQNQSNGSSNNNNQQDEVKTQTNTTYNSYKARARKK